MTMQTNRRSTSSGTINKAFETLVQRVMKGEELYAIPATVVSVDEPNFTCVVDPVDGTAQLSDIRLKPESADPAFFVVPTVGSVVVVVMINKSDGFVVMTSSADKILVRTSGDLELQGDAQSAVSYTPLDAGLQSLVSAIQAELVKIQTGIVGAGGAYTPGTLTLDISAAEVTNVKLP